MKRRYFVFVLVVALASSCSNVVDPAPVDCTLSDLIVQVESVKPASDCSANDAEVTLTASGGVEGYMFRTENGSLQASSKITGLSPGLHVLFVADGAGCERSVEVSIASTSGIAIDDISTSDSGCGLSNGMINVMTSGTGLMFKLDDGEFGTNNVFTGLEAGDYVVSIKDDTGCEVIQDVKVKTGIQFTVVQSIINSNCAVSNCHDGSSSSRPDFTVDLNIKDFSSQIRSRTMQKTMPPASSGLSLSDAQIEQISCWVEDGAIIN